MWNLTTYSGTKYNDLNMVVDKNWWFATLDYEDGMILVSGEGNTAVDAVIDAMRKLTYKAQISFARYAYETRELMPFYWLDYTTFALNGELYELMDRNGKATINRMTANSMTNFSPVHFEDLQFERVNLERTNPPVKQVYNRLVEYQKTIDWQNNLLEYAEW